MSTFLPRTLLSQAEHVGGTGAWGAQVYCVAKKPSLSWHKTFFCEQQWQQQPQILAVALLIWPFVPVKQIQFKIYLQIKEDR